MCTIIIFTIAVAIIFYDEFFLGLIMGMIIGTGIAIMLPVETELIKTTTYNLKTLQDNNNIKSSFFLGSGQIEGKMKYVFYYEKDGFYKLEQIDYENVKIKYSSENPKIEKFEKVKKKGVFINYFAIDMTYDKEYIVYIPEKTIKQNYTLDAQ